MKNLILGLTLITSLSTLAAESLEIRAAKECKTFAVDHALKKEKANWGGEVGVLHVDRSIPMGTLEGVAGTVEGYANVQVVLSRESADPIVYEMAITAKLKKGTEALTCTVTKEVTRELL